MKALLEDIRATLATFEEVSPTIAAYNALEIALQDAARAAHEAAFDAVKHGHAED